MGCNESSLLWVSAAISFISNYLLYRDSAKEYKETVYSAKMNYMYCRLKEILSRMI
jgi:hypothetical protein